MTASLQSVIPKTIPRRAAVIVFDFAPSGGRVLLVTADDGVETFALPGADVIRPLGERIESFLDQQCSTPDGGHRGDVRATIRRPLSLSEVMRDAGCLFPDRLQARLAGFPRLIIIPDDPLFDIPWLAVPFGERFLLDHFPDGISIAPSFSVLRPGQHGDRAEPAAQGDPFHPVESSALLLRPPAHWSRILIAGEARFDPQVPDKSAFELRDGRVTAADLDVRSTIQQVDRSRGMGESGPWSHLACVLSLKGASARTKSLSGGERSGLIWNAQSRGVWASIGTLWPIGASLRRAFLNDLIRQSKLRPLSSAAIQAAHFLRSRFAGNDTFASDWAAITFFGR